MSHYEDTVMYQAPSRRNASTSYHQYDDSRTRRKAIEKEHFPLFNWVPALGIFLNTAAETVDPEKEQQRKRRERESSRDQCLERGERKIARRDTEGWGSETRGRRSRRDSVRESDREEERREEREREMRERERKERERRAQAEMDSQMTYADLLEEEFLPPRTVNRRSTCTVESERRRVPRPSLSANKPAEVRRSSW